MSAVLDRVTVVRGASFRAWRSALASRVVLAGGVLLTTCSLVVLSGCGQDGKGKAGGVTVKGKLMMDGQPLEIVEAGGAKAPVRVVIALAKGNEIAAGGDTKPDGTFTIENVEAGEYTFTVQHMDMAGAAPADRKGSSGSGAGAKGPGRPPGPPSGKGGVIGTNSMDRLKDEFNAEKSPIKVKVGTTPVDLGTIDLKKQETWPK